MGSWNDDHAVLLHYGSLGMYYHVSYLQLWISLSCFSFQGGIRVLESLGLSWYYSTTCVSFTAMSWGREKGDSLVACMFSLERGEREKDAERESYIKGLHTSVDCVLPKWDLFSCRASYYPTTHYHLYCHPGWQGKCIYWNSCNYMWLTFLYLNLAFYFTIITLAGLLTVSRYLKVQHLL